jgi:DNA mismatch endonuclease (patch repair protein)
VFVDGCFWHCCPEHGSQPSANTWYWEPKLRRNTERDRVADAALHAAGWTVIRLWEHEALDAAVAAVTGALGGSARSADSPPASGGSLADSGALPGVATEPAGP